MVRKVNKRHVDGYQKAVAKEDAAIFSCFSEIEKHLMENCAAVFVLECPCGCGKLNCNRLKSKSEANMVLLQVVNDEFSFNMSLRVIN